MDLRVNRNLLLVVGIIVISIGIYYTWNSFQNDTREFIVDEKGIADVQYYQNLSKVSEKTGVFRSSNYTLLYERRWQYRTGPKRPPLYTARRAFYLPSKSLVINVTMNIALSEGTYLPLVVQDLDAPMIQGVNEFNKSTWISPIIWSANVTDTRVYNVTVPSQGWYVVSLCGPVWYYSGTGSLGSRQGGYQTGGWGDPDGWSIFDNIIAEAVIQVVGGDGKLYDFASADETDVK